MDIFSGLSVKVAETASGPYYYLEGGEGDPLVMIPGLGGSKESWIPFMAYLIDKFRLIAPDLPGAGQGGRDLERDYGVESQVASLLELVQALNLPRIHLVGLSMGAHIAGVFAARHPELVRSLTLFDTCGIDSPKKTEFQEAEITGSSLMPIEKPGDLKRMFEASFYTMPEVPQNIMDDIEQNAIREAEFSRKLFKDLTAEPFLLDSVMDAIKAPTLVVWGAQDRINDISGMAVLNTRIKQSQAYIINECGHMPPLEKPQHSAGVFIEFIYNLNMGGAQRIILE